MGASPWPSTVGLAIYAAYLLLLLLFYVLILVFGGLGFARAQYSHSSSAPSVGIGIVALASGGAAVDGHPFWALALSIAAVFFSLWWLNNMAKREG